MAETIFLTVCHSIYATDYQCHMLYFGFAAQVINGKLILKRPYRWTTKFEMSNGLEKNYFGVHGFAVQLYK